MLFFAVKVIYDEINPNSKGREEDQQNDGNYYLGKFFSNIFLFACMCARVLNLYRDFKHN